MRGDAGAAVDSPTERRNPETVDLDLLPTLDLVKRITAEDERVIAAVAEATQQIAAAVDLAVAAIRAGGRVHYVGAGTSGRLAVMDAAELRPTYGVGEEWFVAHQAGGSTAVERAVENAEDDESLAESELGPLGEHDLVVGLTASGRTPYVGAALRHARASGARTTLVTANPRSPLQELVDVAIVCDTGPEVIAGSTRMKAGTAQKLVLNTFSTAVMVRLGRTWSNLMITMQAVNTKLRGRSVTMLEQASDRSPEECARALAECDGELPTALVCLLTDVEPGTARRALDAADGVVRHAVEALREG
ncbi:MAG TPA: N-acetylmuramic acid 6-phosphate etherase [Segeticoccus sp.]|uniref:N-acetylmuramic acid 6-phosphate etherase n=1 Tax=Segeticoccus sp. TaxID=2706531 RepID=UPI002D7FD173|nr:N-acetylmuramic acid 6-phosphate etherase [Segeticoccus sp.]HET8598770.1 N-acetylmuramic acid 6-phosphate etherase [Segeticoccus sp.]